MGRFDSISSLKGQISGASQYYIELGINPLCVVEEVGLKLREIMTNELMANKTTYMPFLQQTDDEQYCHIVDTFRYPGMFSGDMGDLMVKALANVLKTLLILLTNINNYNIITVTPNEFIDFFNFYERWTWTLRHHSRFVSWIN